MQLKMCTNFNKNLRRIIEERKNIFSSRLTRCIFEESSISVNKLFYKYLINTDNMASAKI